jgi:multiple sugar transport system substrate-binding protein
MTFSGLTWDHPRGYDALAEAAKRVNKGRLEPLIHWEKQPLEGFESAPISDLTAKHDLLVIDHPHIGEAVAEECLIPLDDLYDRATLDRWRAGSIGPSMKSYRWEGKAFAVPLDVATHVMVRRADRIATPPTTWDHVEALAADQSVALSLGGPHAFLNLISMVAGDGHVIRCDEMLPDATALSAIERLARLARLAPKGTGSLNPITLLERMARSEDITLIPLIFGYVTYSQLGHTPHPLTFGDTIRSKNGFGGVLGGTGIAFSRRADPSKELLDHVAWLMDVQTQTAFFPTYGGQPSARDAWHDESVNAASGNFYANATQTAETALLRPRFDGYVDFQTRASHILRTSFTDGTDPRATLDHLRAHWRITRQNARGPLDDNRMIE